MNKKKGKSKAQKQVKGAEMPTKPESTEDVSDQERQQQFELELAWCVEQLEMGLTGPKKSSTKQAQDAMKILKTLKNPTAPLVKKRQLMRTTFGDYRAKMKEEEKRFLSSAQKISLKTNGSEKSQQKYTYLKKASASAYTATRESANDSSDSKTPLFCNKTVGDFKFDFKSDDGPEESQEIMRETTENKLENLTLNADGEKRTEAKDKPAAVSESLPKASENATKSWNLKITQDTTFRFNFGGEETDDVNS